MHPLRVLLFASLGIAAAVAGAFGMLLHRVGVNRLESSVFAILVFGAFMLPWSGVFLWAVRRATDLDTLIDRTSAIAAGGNLAIHDRSYHGELDDLARAVEELRVAMEREKAWSAGQRATLAQITAALGEGLIALSPRGRIVLANERIHDMFGTTGALEGRPVVEVVRNQSLISGFDRALAGDVSTDRITLGERQFEMRVFPVVTSAEVAAVALFIDITQIERLQRVRKEFLDDFSHEVRTPLAGLRSAVDTFEAGPLTPEEEAQLRGVMRRQLLRIERLVADLSELKRIESGDLVLEIREVDLSDVLREICDDFRRRMSGSMGRLTLEGGPAPVRVDPVRIQQVFTNLLDNALKHGGGRGEIRVDVTRSGDEAVVRVSDEGDGIPPHEVDRIFHRFYRVDKSRSQTVPGVGLGLAIAKHLVLLHGGTIQAFNRPGRGATFEVRLPAVWKADA